MISKVMIKFPSKFLFQIPLQFYRPFEKVEICDGNVQKFWQVPPSFQPSHFGNYFFFFMIEIQGYWLQRYFKLTNKTFTKKDIVQE